MGGMKLIVSALLVTVACGCAGNAALITARGASTRGDVFEEVQTGGALPQGLSDLQISGSVKTHRPGAHLATDRHGTPDYRLLLNIDGQALLLPGTLRSEEGDSAEGGRAESGDGIRYRFDRKLRLKAGAHRIVVALPEEGVAVERDMTLPEGGGNRLVLEPVYHEAPGKTRPGVSAASFREGVWSITLTLNGRDL